MDKLLFRLAEFLSRPPGFNFVIVAMLASTALVPSAGRTWLPMRYRWRLSSSPAFY